MKHFDIPPLDRQTRLQAAAFIALIDAEANAGTEIVPGAAMRSLLRDLNLSGLAGLTSVMCVDTGAQRRTLTLVGIVATTHASSDHALLTAWKQAARDRIGIPSGGT